MFQSSHGDKYGTGKKENLTETEGMSISVCMRRLFSPERGLCLSNGTNLGACERGNLTETEGRLTSMNASSFPALDA